MATDKTGPPGKAGLRSRTGEPPQQKGGNRQADPGERRVHRKIEERLDQALTASGMGVWEWDIKTGVMFRSPESCKILGLKDSSGRLTDFTAALHPEDAARVRMAMDRALADKTLYGEEFRIIRPDGEVRWLKDLGRATYDENGQPLRMTGTVQDITAQRLNEEVLQRYELLANHSRDIILFIKKDDGRILEANAAAVAAYGYSREELLALTICDLRAAESPGTIAEEMAKANGNGLLFETVHRRKDGGTCPMEVSSRGATIGGTRILISVIRDISTRKKTEEALREREELFRMTFDKSPIAAAMVDLGQRITLSNREFCRMLGYREEEIIGMTLRDITQQDDIEAALINFGMMASGSIDGYKMEKRYLRKDGSIVWGQLSAGLIRDAAGRPSYGIGMIEDITGRKQTERYQRLTAEILGILNDPSTLDESIDLVLTGIKRETGFDAVGIRLRSGNDYPYFVQNGFSQDFLITENTLVARNTDGVPCRDASGRMSLECTCGLVLSGRTDQANPFFTKGGSFWTNNSLPLLDLTAGEDPRRSPRNVCVRRGYLSMALIPIPVNREIVGLLQLNDRKKDRFSLEMVRLFEGIAASIGTALVRKQTERVLEERSERLEEVNKELESFSYSVSHDLRAPLRAIEGYSRMILRREGERFGEETKRQFSLIRDNALRMEQLINDILAFSRLGRQEMALTLIDMNQLAVDVWEELLAANPGRKAPLMSDGLPPSMGDRTLIAQVLTNLLSNAIKYSGTRDAPLVEMGGHVRENETVYYVRDNGVGFDMAYYHKLFGVFQRLHSVDEFEGTGVGLAIVQRIIRRHGGRVWAEGKVDDGATFSFSLPRK